MSKVVFDATFKVADQDAKTFKQMLDSCGFYGRLNGISSKLPKEMEGLNARNTGNGTKVYVGYGYGNYGINKVQMYFDDAFKAWDFLKKKKVRLDMLKSGCDPCLFNGL